MSPERPARRNIGGPLSSADDSPLPGWTPAEIRALHEHVRASTREDARDLVVVGAGITGAGIARDAATRGLDVLVLEANDIAFGTSSRSSRLIHGGVRYLEQGAVGLVFEALRERARLYRIASHLVKPARFLFPTFAGDRLPMWKLRVGLSLYDALSLFRAGRHRSMGAARARELEPMLELDGLRGAVSYEDAVTDDSRLTLSTLQSARRHSADVLTYAPVVRVSREPAPGDDGQRLFIAHLADGARVFARQIVIATGPWTSERLLGEPGRELLALSRGIHLVLRAADVPVRQPLVIQARGERRILFVIPWGARTYIGTTDTGYTGDPGASGVEPGDVEDLLVTIGRHLTGANLTPDRIISGWSGVRPLVRARSARSGTAELSRKHRVVENADGILAIVGGKLTTYRAMAEDIVDRTVRNLRKSSDDVRVRPCSTHEHPLVPGPPLSAEELANPVAADLAPRHGPDTRVLLRRIADAPELAERLVEDLPYRRVEAVHAIEYEGCTHLDDLLRRRLPLALTDPRLGAGVARWIAERLVDAWGGREHDVQQEIERYRERVHGESGYTVPPVD